MLDPRLWTSIYEDFSNKTKLAYLEVLFTVASITLINFPLLIIILWRVWNGKQILLKHAYV